jgi:hypothetical protein
MVAAVAANPAPDVSNASELGSLLLGYRSISDPRWRLRAVVALVQVCLKFGISLDTLRGELRRGVHAAVCAPLWRPRLEALFAANVERGCTRGVERLVDALFTRDSRACGIAAITAALVLDDGEEANRLASASSCLRYAHGVAMPLVRSGCVDGTFVGNLQRTGSEQQFRPSLPLLRALVDQIVEDRDRERAIDAEQLARRLSKRDRAVAEAQLARLTLCFESVRAALMRARAIRERSIRAGALLLLTRAARDFDAMRTFASAIETTLLRQVGTLELARALYRRGLHRHARRALQHVEDARLEAERIVFEHEVRLTVRHTSETGVFVSECALREAYTSPGWTFISPRVDVDTQRRVATATLLLRFGMRKREDDIVVEHAGQVVRHYAFCTIARRAWLDLAERAGIDIHRALLAMQNGHNAPALDALRAEHVAMRATAAIDTTLSPAMALGLATQPISTADARSLERAQFDEGFALSSAAASRRRVLIATAQTCLRAALASPHEWSAEVIAARLRTLVHLGGGLAVETIRKALVTLPAHATLTPLALEALCQLDASVAMGFVLERANDLCAAGVDVLRALHTVEVYGGLPRGSARAYARAYAKLTRNGHDAQPWLAELFGLMRTRVDSLLRILAGLAAHTVIPTNATALLAEVDRVPLRFVAADHVAIAAQLVKDTTLLEALLLAWPPTVDPKMQPWSTDEWRTLLRKTVEHTAIHREVIARFVRRIDRVHWYDALLACDLARLGVAMTMAFKAGNQEYVLRVLDKRRDIFTYLRFADVPARSCMRSDSDYFHVGDMIEAWKDPLTICCRIERRAGERFQPIGFLFGGFATVEDQPALVMNSLHVRPNQGELRKQAIRAFERAVADPLAIQRVGIANVFGGEGELPPTYVERDATLIRYRALAIDGWPLREIYDDTSIGLGEPTKVEGLYWRS